MYIHSHMFINVYIFMNMYMSIYIYGSLWFSIETVRLSTSSVRILSRLDNGKTDMYHLDRRLRTLQHIWRPVDGAAVVMSIICVCTTSQPRVPAPVHASKNIYICTYIHVYICIHICIYMYSYLYVYERDDKKQTLGKKPPRIKIHT